MSKYGGFFWPLFSRTRAENGPEETPYLDAFHTLSLFFNIFLCELFLELENCCYANYADETTLFVIASNSVEVLENLKNITQTSSIGLLTIK